MKKHLFIVRHSQTDYNAKGICQGRSCNLGLSDIGRQQAKMLGLRLQNKNIAAIYVSPLKRAKETGEIIAQVLNLPVQEHQDLIEGNFGIAEGKPMSEVKKWAVYPQWCDSNSRYDDVHYENGESKTQIRQRALKAIAEICAREEAENILLVSHSAIVRLLNWLVGNFIQGMPNGAIFEFIYEDGQLTLVERLLLLSCCAPCSCAVIKTLAEQKRNFTVAFYNPNIRPYSEYLKRRDENARVCQLYGIKFVELEYDNERWCQMTKGLENEPERGKRCSICFEMRLQRVMDYAKDHGYTAVASVLGVSRWKDLNQVNEAAFQAGAKTGMLYVEIEGRKNGMQELRNQLIKELGLYNQNYCGCKPQD